MPMLIKWIAAMALVILLLNGCGGTTASNTKSTYLSGIGFYNQGKKSEIEGTNEADIFQEKTESTSGSKSLHTNEMPSSFFLLEPEPETWRAYNYYFHVRKRIYQNLPGIIPESEFDIPVVLNDKVRYFLSYFQYTRPDIFSEWLSRSGKYIPMMTVILESKGLPKDLVYLAMIESGFSVRARSHKGAVGPWQFINSTGRRYGLRIDSWVDERMDPEKSTRAAADYLQDLYVMFESWELAAAGYNTGENRIKSAIETYRVSDFWEISEYTLPEETKDYVPKLMAALIIARNPEKYGFTGIEYLEPEPFEKVSAPPQRSLKDISRITGVSYERLRELNASLIMGSTPPGNAYEINVPQGYGRVITANYDEIEASEKVEIKSRVTRHEVIRYKVRRGDTLSKIASRHGVGVSSLKKANGMRGTTVRIGQVLRIPGARGSAYVRDNNTNSTVKKGGSVKNVTKATTRYRVKKGDTIQKIANRFGVQVSSLMKVNNKSKPGNLRAGEFLTIPGSSAVALSSRRNKASQKSDIKNMVNYRVKNGDTLWKIASRYDVSVTQIKKWNNLKSSKLAAGEKLRIYAD